MEPWREGFDRGRLVVDWIVPRRCGARRLGRGKPSDPREYALTESAGEPCRDVGDRCMDEMPTRAMSRLRMLPAGVVRSMVLLKEVRGEARTPLASRPRMLFPEAGVPGTQGTGPAGAWAVWAPGSDPLGRKGEI